MNSTLVRSCFSPWQRGVCFSQSSISDGEGDVAPQENPTFSTKTAQCAATMKAAALTAMEKVMVPAVGLVGGSGSISLGVDIADQIERALRLVDDGVIDKVAVHLY